MNLLCVHAIPYICFKFWLHTQQQQKKTISSEHETMLNLKPSTVIQSVAKFYHYPDTLHTYGKQTNQQQQTAITTTRLMKRLNTKINPETNLSLYLMDRTAATAA